MSVHECAFSDHSLVMCTLSLSICQVPNEIKRVRCWRKANFDGFVNELLSSPLCDKNFFG